MDEISPVERLLGLAEAILFDRRTLLIPDEHGITDSEFARIRVALDLAKQPPKLRLRAIVEEWDYQRINREMY